MSTVHVQSNHEKLKKNKHFSIRCINFAAVDTTRPPKTCCIDVTTSCISKDMIDAFDFVNMMLFTKENKNFADVSRQDKCYSAI